MYNDSGNVWYKNALVVVALALFISTVQVTDMNHPHTDILLEVRAPHWRQGTT